MSMKGSIKEEREDKGMERGLAFLGYLALLGLICWQYFNLTRGGPVLAVTAAGILGVVAGWFAVGNTRSRFVHFLIRFLFLFGFVYWLCYNLTHGASPVITVLSWVLGLVWSWSLSVQLGDGLPVRLLNTVSLWGSILFYGGAFLLLLPAAAKSLAGYAAARDWLRAASAAVLCVPLVFFGVYSIAAVWKMQIAGFFICYLHTGLGPRLQVTEGKSYRVPKTMKYAYAALRPHDFRPRPGRDAEYYGVLCIRCADLAYELYQTRDSQNKKYALPADKELGSFEIGVFFTGACALLEKEGEISRARDYVEKRLELYGWQEETDYDFCQIMRDRQRLDDGRPKDPAAEEELLEKWKRAQEKSMGPNGHPRRERGEKNPLVRKILEESEGDPDKEYELYLFRNILGGSRDSDGSSR